MGSERRMRPLPGLLLIILALLAGCTSYLTIGEERIAVEIADTPQERQQGLMGRTLLFDGQGMLFVFDTPDYYSFWMRNVNFPLDIIFISANSTIIGIREADPCFSENCLLYVPAQPALYVLEVPQGYSAAHDITEGMTVEFGNLK